MNLSPAYLKWEEETLEKCERKGREVEALSYTIRLLNRRLGSVSPVLQNQIQQLPKSELESLGEAVLDFSTEVDLISWLSQSKSGVENNDG